MLCNFEKPPSQELEVIQVKREKILLNTATEVFSSHLFSVLLNSRETANQLILEGMPNGNSSVSVGLLNTTAYNYVSHFLKRNGKHLKNKNEEVELLTFNTFSINICPLFQ